MNYIAPKNLTAKELWDMDKKRINLVVYGFSFTIIIDPDFKRQTCMYVDRRDPNSNLVPSTVDKEFHKLSTLRSAIEKELNSLYNQIGDFKKDYDKASIKHFNYDLDESLSFNKDSFEQESDLRSIALNHPTRIENIDPCIFSNHTDIVIKCGIKLCEWQIFDEYLDYFLQFNSDIAREIVSSFLSLNDFQKKAFFRPSQTAEDIYRLIIKEKALS